MNIYIRTIHLFIDTQTNLDASWLQMKIKCFYVWDHLVRSLPFRMQPPCVMNTFIPSSNESVQPCISDQYLFMIVSRLCNIDFPIQQQRDINVYYYYHLSFPFAICVFCPRFQFAFKEWSQGMRCGEVKRCVCSPSLWGLELRLYS